MKTSAQSRFLLRLCPARRRGEGTNNEVNWAFGICSGTTGHFASEPYSALAGRVDDFQTVLGWKEAKPGGTFIKIGVGVLRKGDGNYNRHFPYKVLEVRTLGPVVSS